ncbi:MAG TPA: phenylalanine--tRNA ligase subunit beta, partial [Burkholderiales bacterium]
ARSLGIQTESSQRFERGVDPELQVRALERATELLVAVAGGDPGPIAETKSGRRAPLIVPLRRARLERLVGCAVPTKKVEQVLKGLGMKVRKTADGWRVVPPSYRFDIRIEPDLIEETVRLFGYSNIPARMPAMQLVAPEVPESRLQPKRLRTLLIDRDYQEVITYSFVDPDLQKLIDPSGIPMTLANPISADMSVMRTTLWPSLLQTLRYNRNRQLERVRLFETGRRYLAGIEEPKEEAVIAGVASGTASAEQWGVAEREVDFYDVKGDIEALLALGGRSEEFRFLAASHPALHPGQSAAIHFGEEQIGWVGVLHPGLQARLELGPAVLFELKLSALGQRRLPAFAEVSRFPAIRRDLAIVVSEETSAQQVVESIRTVAGNLLMDLELFDVYRGEGIDSGRKSFALGLTFQHSSRTLREAEVDALMTQIISTLAGEVGAQLRH